MQIRRPLILIYLATAFAVAVVLAVLELGVRLHERSRTATIAGSVPELMTQMMTARISGREIGNQMLVHNMALFSANPDPGSVMEAYVGTSRTKVLRPSWTGHTHAVNASGNSYNEITYGLLMQAEVARLQFPNLKRVYFEASLLLRRPDRLIVEPDHTKYLPLLESLLPLRNQLPGSEVFRTQLASAKSGKRKKAWRLELFDHREDMRLTQLLPSAFQTDNSTNEIPVRGDRLFQELDPTGQRKADPVASIPKQQQRPEVTKDNIKVQRLREIKGWAPWDGLYDMVALWGEAHGIEIVLFQPPVRSDLYRYQVEMGLADHVADLRRVSLKYGIPFIDMNRPELGYMSDWALFSDEDHLETCEGIFLIQTKLNDEYGKFGKDGGASINPPGYEFLKEMAKIKCATKIYGTDR